MKKSTPVRIDEELYAAATVVAPVMSRSTSQQIVHWARIGRELEASPGFSIDEVVQVLRGEREYDSVETQTQAVVRAHWAERMNELRESSLRLDRRFAAEGRPYAELDAEGRVVVREPGATHGLEPPPRPGL